MITDGLTRVLQVIVDQNGGLTAIHGIGQVAAHHHGATVPEEEIVLG
jgi:hypothetical protein